jgi:hypothetical protein
MHICSQLTSLLDGEVSVLCWLLTAAPLPLASRLVDEERSADVVCGSAQLVGSTSEIWQVRNMTKCCYTRSILFVPWGQLANKVMVLLLCVLLSSLALNTVGTGRLHGACTTTQSSYAASQLHDLCVPWAAGQCSQSAQQLISNAVINSQLSAL